jgi:CelD/BcsL family acetyltransferase involved in cellulose biosynthesis
MFVRDRPASLHLALRFDGMLAGWFPAYDVSLGSYGVGNIHHLQILRQAAQSGVEFFDFGAGDEPYKRTFGDSAHLVAKGSASAPSAVALTHRIQSASTKLVTDFVLNHPPLRRAARQALNLLGSVRILLHSRVRLRGSGSRR